MTAAIGSVMQRSVWLASVAILLLFALIAGLFTSVTPTHAAWTDRVAAQATVKAAVWAQAPEEGCTAMTSSGQPLAGGTCSITSVGYSESGHPGARTHNYHVALNSNAGSGYIRLTVDLSKATGTASSFSWANAGVGHGHITVASDWSCASLPVLTGDTAVGGNWGSHSSIEFHVYEDRSAHPVQCA